MTDAQQELLRRLTEQAGEEYEFTDMTDKEANIAIRERIAINREINKRNKK